MLCIYTKTCVNYDRISNKISSETCSQDIISDKINYENTKKEAQLKYEDDKRSYDKCYSEANGLLIFLKKSSTTDCERKFKLKFQKTKRC